jgi:hypothetical protein
MKGKYPLAAILLISTFGLLAGCRIPKYAAYVSPEGDFKAYVPWGWRVVADHEGTHYAQTSFIGPFDPAFYRGAPSLDVRWYSYDYPHSLVDGDLEMYTDAEDYIRQTLSTVYDSPQRVMSTPLETIQVSGRSARHFVVFAPTPANEREFWGVVNSKAKVPYVLRRHAYAILPLARGFYVLIYPATDDGFKRYEPEFNELVNTFTAVKDGPGGFPLK